MNTQEVPGWKIDASRMPPAAALQIMARELPNGWTVQLNIQRGNGSVTLFGPQDDMYEPKTGRGIEADMLEALRFALFRETESDKAVDRAWDLFQAEMRQVRGL